MSQIRNRKQVVREREPLLFHSDESRSSSSGSPPPSYSSINTHAAASVQYPTGREDFFRNLFSRLQELFSDIFKTLAFWKEEDLVRDDPEIQEMLASLKAHITCPFDYTNSEHKEELDAFWTLHFGEPVPPVPSPEWRRLGFQNDNPLSDFRGPTSRFQLQCLLAYRPPLRPSETLPFVLAGMAICNLLLEFLGLGMLPRAVPSARSALCRLLFRPTQKPHTALVQALQNEDLSSPESRLRALVVLVLRGLEDRWAAANAGYMDFPAQLKTTADLFTADLAALY